MIHTLFILTKDGEILMEKHWRAKVPREAGEEFWVEVSKASSPEDVPPVIATNKYYFAHIYTGGLFFLAILHGEAPPAMTLKLLDDISKLFHEYFSGLNESKIKNNFVTCYQLLEEMVDNGFPVQTEPTVLKELVPTPSLLRGSSVNPEMTAKSLAESPVPWRKTGLKYSNPEIFFSIVEQMDALLDVNGNLISSEIYGKIECQTRMPGMPDLLAAFLNQNMLEDASFHPCVRLPRYEQDRSLSFIPPDGTFELMQYRVSRTGKASAPAPFYVTPTVTLQEDHGRINIIVGLRGGGMGTSDKDKGITEFSLFMTLPENTDSVKMEASQGSSSYSPDTKIFRWNIGKVTKQKAPTINGTVIPVIGTKFPKGSTPSVMVEFKLPQYCTSGLKIDSVSMSGENYKYFKGMKASTHNGRYEIRTS